MLANYIHTRCVNPCRSVFISVGILNRLRIDLRLDETSLAALKKRSYPTFNEQDHNVKLRASTLQAEKKLTASMLMEFILIATLYKKLHATKCFNLL